LSVLAAVPGIGIAALAIAIPTLAGFVLVAVYGRETRGRDLRELEG
jgi:putative MFS transporter